MIKLYKTADNSIRYHEAWLDDGKILEHWGQVGERGESRSHAIESDEDEDDEEVLLEHILAPARAGGYDAVAEDQLRVLVLEYVVDGFGSDRDQRKRAALMDRLDQTLGWTGLGHVDGGSVGSGTMDVVCLVVDVGTARRVIEADLEGTEFGDYERVYEDVEAEAEAEGRQAGR
jgi:hypothetical protein